MDVNNFIEYLKYLREELESLEREIELAVSKLDGTGKINQRKENLLIEELVLQCKEMTELSSSNIDSHERFMKVIDKYTNIMNRQSKEHLVKLMERRMRAERIINAILALPHPYRNIISDRFLEGLSVNEIIQNRKMSKSGYRKKYLCAINILYTNEKMGNLK